MGPFGWRQAVVRRWAPGGHRQADWRQRQLPARPRPRRLQLVRQDELPELGAPGVALRGDVHIGGVGAQQPGALQAEGDALSAAVHLQGHTQVTLTHRNRSLTWRQGACKTTHRAQY